MILTHREIGRLIASRETPVQIKWLNGYGIDFTLDHAGRPLVDSAELNRSIRQQKPDTRQRVYVLPAGRLVKVGIARDVEFRRKELRTGNPLIREVAYESEPLDRARWVEAQVHQELAALRVNGEWFRCKIAVAVAAIKRWEAKAV